MTKIKICGITRLSDALDACRAGADALGFNFSAKSPRNITPEQARKIILRLPPFVATAGIFVEHSPEEINEICHSCGIRIAQLHNDEYTPDQARTISGAMVMKVFRPEHDFNVARVFEFAEKSGISSFLFDAFRPGTYGGTGEVIEDSLAGRIFNDVRSSCYAVLAGGLNETNVRRAIVHTRPYGVDVASGVEHEPGIKDAVKMRAFIREVRATVY
ncbi:MAG: phosphoribosylanthranilate isomerase [Chlorobiaceae bacterium]|nr:phosphoribosylanthranilate isomerase [Chlorobiaceae bacterium]NTV61812.1 phosphoribosylanthranilate isomerase [Chlorobiaceae bacterium]